MYIYFIYINIYIYIYLYICIVGMLLTQDRTATAEHGLARKRSKKTNSLQELINSRFKDIKIINQRKEFCR